MSNQELVTIDSKQFAQLATDLVAISNACWGIKDVVVAQGHDTGKWLGAINDTLAEMNATISAGFDEVAEAIAKLQPLPPPQPKMRGTIMADYQIPDDTPDGTFSLAITATDSEGVPITDPAVLASLQAEVVNSNEDAFVATLDETNRAGTYHVGAPGQAVITQNLKDADGNLLATGTDSFTVTTGKVALGSVKATFDGLTPIS